MELNDNGVKVSRTASDISASSSSDELTASSSDSCVTIGSINGNTITLNGGASVGSSTITVSYGSHTATCSASVVVVTPTETSVANANSSTPTPAAEAAPECTTARVFAYTGIPSAGNRAQQQESSAAANFPTT